MSHLLSSGELTRQVSVHLKKLPGTDYIYHFVTVPLDSPQNFVAEAINSTSIHLSWDQPLTPNGVITHYLLKYSKEGSFSVPVTITDTMYMTIKNLSEYTEYTFVVAAATSAGIGPQAETFERTAEDGMYIIV